MEQLLLNALGQAPVLTIMLVFLYLNNREWRKYLIERNSKIENAFKSMTDELKSSNDRLFNHIEKHK